mgnify:CR=1 FL=1
MKKVISGIIITLSIILIGFVIIFSIIPNIVLNVKVTIGGFAIPIFIIIITMIVEIKKSKDAQEKSEIRNFWLKVLFIIYCLLLITILFLNNEYRMGGFQNINTFSKEHFETSNVVPFATIIEYIIDIISNDINTGIVIINFATNLLLFAPMGFFIPILFKNRIKNIKQFVIMMIILTLVVEILQFITYRGSTDIDDIILNTIGAVIVYVIMKTKVVKKLLKKVFDIAE